MQKLIVVNCSGHRRFGRSWWSVCLNVCQSTRDWFPGTSVVFVLFFLFLTVYQWMLLFFHSEVTKAFSLEIHTFDQLNNLQQVCNSFPLTPPPPSWVWIKLYGHFFLTNPVFGTLLWTFCTQLDITKNVWLSVGYSQEVSTLSEKKWDRKYMHFLLFTLFVLECLIINTAITVGIGLANTNK